MGEQKPLPIKCLSDVQAVDLLSLPHFSSGIESLDRVIQGLFENQLIVVTGKRGQGKSTFASWILANALNQGRKVFAYSGELPDFHFRNWLDFQISGIEGINKTQNKYGDAIYSLKQEYQDKLTAFYKGRAYIFDNSFVDEENTLQKTLCDSIVYAATELGCKVILIDNIMTAIDISDNDAYKVQSSFVKNVKALARQYDLSIILIAHPRKTESGKEFSNDDVSGTGDITNIADIVLAYSRIPESKPESKQYQGAISVTKNRLTGKLAVGDGTIKVIYSEATKRIVSNANEGAKKLCCFSKNFEETKEMESLPF